MKAFFNRKKDEKGELANKIKTYTRYNQLLEEKDDGYLYNAR